MTRQSCMKALRYFVLNEEHTKDALQFLRKHFFLHDPVSVAMESTTHWDRAYTRHPFIASGVSVGAMDTSTSELVSLNACCLQTRDKKWDFCDESLDMDEGPQHCLSYWDRRPADGSLPSSMAIFLHVILGQNRRRFKILRKYIESNYDIFNELNVNKVIYMGPAATHPAYQGQGIMRKLFKMSEDLGREQGYEVASGMSLNPVMQAMGRKLGYEVIYRLECHNLIIDNVRIFNNDLLPKDTALEVTAKRL